MMGILGFLQKYGVELVNSAINITRDINVLGNMSSSGNLSASGNLTVLGDVNSSRVVCVRRVALAALDTAGGVLSVANPAGVDIIVTKVVLDVTTKSTGACTLDVGIAADGATSNDTLLDGVDVGTAAGLFDNVTNKGTNGKPQVKWGASQFLTASKATGSAAGLVGNAYIHYMRA